MEHPRLVSPKSFCHNPDCPDYGKVNRGNIIKYGRTQKGTRRYRCKICRATFVSRGHPHTPPAIATDGQGGYREAPVKTWGQVPKYSGRGRPPTQKQPQSDWRYLQVVKRCAGRRLVGVTVRVVYGDSKEVRALLGEHTAYVERTNLTARQMNGRPVRKTLSFSKKLEMLKASCAREDRVYNLTRPVKSLRIEVGEGGRRRRPRSPAMVAGLTNHIWTVKELLMTVVLPDATNTN